MGVSDAGWVAELDRLKLVDEYTWWRNRNSITQDECFSCNCSYEEVTFAKRQPMKNPDLIVVSASPHVVPPAAQCLFSIFENMTLAWFDSQ